MNLNLPTFPIRIFEYCARIQLSSAYYFRKVFKNVCFIGFQNGICTNMEGSFQCSCNEGFTLSASGDTCIDTDECTAIPNTCGNGTCINTFGSYRCRCFYGFQMSSDNNCQGSVDSVPHTDR